MARKDHLTRAQTFWFKGISLLSLVTFNEACGSSRMLSISIHLLLRFNRFQVIRITALSFELHTFPLPKTRVKAELSQMDGIVQKSLLLIDLESPNTNFLSHFRTTFPAYEKLHVF
jgi:hypothetical protein